MMSYDKAIQEKYAYLNQMLRLKHNHVLVPGQVILNIDLIIKKVRLRLSALKKKKQKEHEEMLRDQYAKEVLLLQALLHMLEKSRLEQQKRHVVILHIELEVDLLFNKKVRARITLKPLVSIKDLLDEFERFKQELQADSSFTEQDLTFTYQLETADSFMLRFYNNKIAELFTTRLFDQGMIEEPAMLWTHHFDKR